MKQLSRYFFIIISFIILNIFNQNSLLSQTKKITLDEAISIAIKNNYTLQSARYAVQKAEARKDEALGTALPSLNITANYTNNIIKPKFFMPNFMDPSSKDLIPVTIASTNQFTTSAQLTQILFNSAVFTGIGTAKMFYQTSQVQLKGQLVQTITDVRKNFNAVLLAGEYVKVVETSQANAKSNLITVEKLYGEGFIPEYDLIRAKVGVQNIDPELYTAKMNYTNLLNLLKMNLGLNIQENIEIEGRIVEPELRNLKSDSLLNELRNTNYNLRALEMATKVNEEIVSLYKSEYYPTITAFGNYSYQGQSNTLDFNVVRSSSVGVNFSLSLFQGFQSQNRVQQARIDYLNTKEKYDQLLETMKMSLNNSLYKMEVAKEKVKTLAENVAMAKRGYEIAEIRYKEGVGNQVEINDANTAFSKANLGYLQALLDLWDSQIEIDNLTSNVPVKYLNQIDN